MELIKVLKALADETRIRILNLLRNEELCVCEIEHLLGINQSNASRHLNKLNDAGLITYRKKAQWVYYRINEKTLNKYPFLHELLDNELDREEQCRSDHARLKAHQASGITCEQLRQHMRK